MAALPNNIYNFDSLYNALDFIKPLIVEGYSVVIQKIYGETLFPTCERKCMGFQVEIGPKGEEVKVYLPNEKAESEECKYNKEDRFKDANLNDYIKVKLTDKGKQIYKDYYDNDPPTLDVDDEEYVKFQMWDFMKIFGEHMHMGGPMICETNVKIQTR